MIYKPHAGDIGLTQIKGRVGRGIRVAQFMAGGGFWDYEHAFVMTNWTELVEAEPGGAIVSDLSRYDDCDVVFLRCPDEFRTAVAAAALGMVDVPYSFLDYESLFLRHIGIKADRLEKYIRDSGHMICSQLADRAANLGGWILFDDKRWEGDVMPADITRLYQIQRAARMRAGDTSR